VNARQRWSPPDAVRFEIARIRSEAVYLPETSFVRSLEFVTQAEFIHIDATPAAQRVESIK
jgi:hypothetical protein